MVTFDAFALHISGLCRKKEAASSVSHCLVITKNNRAHRGTGLDQPHIPTTPPLLTETNENTGCRGAPAEAQGGVQSGFAPLLVRLFFTLKASFLAPQCALLRCSRAHGMKNVVMRGGKHGESQNLTHGVGGITKLRVCLMFFIMPRIPFLLRIYLQDKASTLSDCFH